MCAVAPSGECLRGKSPPDRMLGIPWRRLFLAAFGLNLVVVAVLRVKVERFVLTTINEDVMLCYIIGAYRRLFDAVHRRSISKPEEFWGEAAEDIAWFKRWDKVLDDTESPFTKWCMDSCFKIILTPCIVLRDIG